MQSKIFIFLFIFVAGFLVFLVIDKSKNSLELQNSQNTVVVDLSDNADVDTNSTNEPIPFIESLRNSEFPGSDITIEEELGSNDTFTSYLISYISDDLKIYGMMNMPKGTGLFPVIILNHGYFNASSFNSGDGTKAMADVLARNGYLTLASDYRGHGKSESDGKRSGHRPEYAIDVLNLVASVKNIQQADATRIGMWGHSMGGEVALRVAEATNDTKAIVLWAPTSARTSDNSSFYGRGAPSMTRNSEAEGSSPINYLQYISTPISLHQGLADTEVKPEWSKELKEALEKEGKQVEYFEYPGQDHNFRNLGWDVISDRTVTFFDKYLK